MKTKYKITSTHSGTNKKEIEKAKRHYRKEFKRGLFGFVTDIVNIQFIDINYSIIARYYNEYGNEICNACLIHKA